MRRSGQYLRFLVSGSVVGVASIAFFEVLRRAVGAQDLWVHGIVVSMTYLFGVLLSYWLQQSFVFARRMAVGLAPFLAFLAICAGASIVAGAVSGALLAWPPLRGVFSTYAPAASLIIAALAVSPASFLATRRFFGRGIEDRHVD